MNGETPTPTVPSVVYSAFTGLEEAACAQDYEGNTGFPKQFASITSFVNVKAAPSAHDFCPWKDVIRPVMDRMIAEWDPKAKAINGIIFG